jgi:hypothetical protein
MTLYYQSLGEGTSSDTLSPTITWIDPQGNAQSLAYPYLGSINGDASDGLQNYSLPFLVKGGTELTVSTAYGVGSTPFSYNLALAIQAIPSTAASQVGTKFVVHAMASHR